MERFTTAVADETVWQWLRGRMEVRRRAVWITFRQSCASRKSQGELCIIESAAFSSDFHHRCAVCCKATRLFQVRKVGSKLAALLLEVFFRSEGKGWDYFCSCSPASLSKPHERFVHLTEEPPPFSISISSISEREKLTPPPGTTKTKAFTFLPKRVNRP